MSDKMKKAKISLKTNQHFSVLQKKEEKSRTDDKVVNMCQFQNGCKAVSNILGLQQTTARATDLRWREHGAAVRDRRTNTTIMLHHKLTHRVTKEPRTSTALHNSLVSAKVIVHKSTTAK